MAILLKLLLKKVVKSRADGVILFNNEEIEKEIALVNKYKIPAVVIGTSVTGKYMGSIFADAKKIAYEVVDKYLAQGKSDILFVSPKQNLINIEEMITGIQEAYQKYDLVFDATKQVVHTSSHYEKKLSTIF